MFVPLILSALAPLNPAHFMRELIAWFACILLDTLDNPETRAWIRENPKDRSVLLDLLGSLVFIEDMIATFTFLRAGQMLGYSHRPGRRGRRPGYDLTGHPPSLEEIERRFHRALRRFEAVERNSARLVVRLARLLTNPVSQLERVHHPVGPSTTTTILCAPESVSTQILKPAWALGIRAPP
jgi:hypothetical protein